MHRLRTLRVAGTPDRKNRADVSRLPARHDLIMIARCRIGTLPHVFRLVHFPSAYQAPPTGVVTRGGPACRRHERDCAHRYGGVSRIGADTSLYGRVFMSGRGLDYND